MQHSTSYLLVLPQFWCGTARVLAGEVSQSIPSHRREGRRVQFWADGAPWGLPVGEVRQRVTTADIRGGRLRGGGVGIA